MSLYADFIYGEEFFGSDEFGVGPGAPANLNSYQNVIENVVLYWTLNPCTPTIDEFTWTVETDLEDTFASPDLRTYVSSDQNITIDAALVTGNTISIDVDAVTVSSLFATDSNTTLAAFAALIEAEPGVLSATVVSVGPDSDRVIVVRATDPETAPVLSSASVTGGASQAGISFAASYTLVDGEIHKGIVVPIYTRLQGENEEMHWRVKGIRFGAETAFSSSLFEEPAAIDELTRDNILGFMPDAIYKKSSDGNIYKLHDGVGDAFDLHHIENVFVNNDISTSKVRDLTIQSKFGDMFEIIKPASMHVVDYREVLRQFMIEARSSPTVLAVRNMVRAMLCEEPTIALIKDGLDKYVDDPAEGVLPPYVDDAGSAPPVLPPTMWSNQELGHGVTITVTNPLGVSITNDFMVGILRKLIPAHVSLFVVGL